MKVRQRHLLGPFWGEFETSVLEGGRIRLPVNVVRQFEDAGVEKIYFGILPHQKALVVIPQAMWPDWIKRCEKQEPILGTAEGFRSFIFPSSPNWWGPGGRIYIPDRLLRYAGLHVEQPLVILGVGDYFEIWNSDAYEEMRRRCEEALQTPKPVLPPAPLRDPDSHSPKKDERHGKAEGEIPF